jgi:hypothetical protein
VAHVRAPQEQGRTCDLSPRAALDDASLRELAAVGARHMDACMGGLVFRIGRLGLGLAESTALAVHIAELLRDHLVEAGAPHDLRVEVDADQACQVPAGWESRGFLPHHDSSHCSFLTPSILDVPGWRPEERATHGSGITRTDTHKLYQGFLVVHSGDAVGTTSFYNKIALLRRAFAATNDRGCSVARVGGMARAKPPARPACSGAGRWHVPDPGLVPRHEQYGLARSAAALVGGRIRPLPDGALSGVVHGPASG